LACIQFDPFKELFHKGTQGTGPFIGGLQIFFLLLAYHKSVFYSFQIACQGGKRCLDVMGKIGDQLFIGLFVVLLLDGSLLALLYDLVDTVANGSYSKASREPYNRSTTNRP